MTDPNDQTLTDAGEDRVSPPLRQCAPWCETGDGHPKDAPEERDCWSAYDMAPLLAGPAYHELSGDPLNGQWLLPRLTVTLRRKAGAVDTRVVLHAETEPEIELYLDLVDARWLRDALGRALNLEASAGDTPVSPAQKPAEPGGSVDEGAAHAAASVQPQDDGGTASPAAPRRPARTTEPSVGPCPDWCTLPAGHGWDAEGPGGAGTRRQHLGPQFGLNGPRVEVVADDYADEAEIRPMVVSVLDADGTLSPWDALLLTRWLTEATDWVVEHGPAVWWKDFPNPECRAWCAVTHDPAEFSKDGGSLFCRRTLVSSDRCFVEVTATTEASNVAGAPRGSLVHNAPDLTIDTYPDVSSEFWSVAGSATLALELIPALHEGARIVGDDRATEAALAAESSERGVA